MGISKPTSGARKKFTIKDPNGNIVEIYGIREFCRKHNLNHIQLWRVAIGKQKEYNGWKSIYNIIGKNFKSKVVAKCDSKEYFFDSMMDAVRSKLFDFPIFQQNISICCNKNPNLVER
jgi:hypothetical protein